MLKGCQVYLDVCIGGFELEYKTDEVSFVKRERIRVLLEEGFLWKTENSRGFWAKWFLPPLLPRDRNRGWIGGAGGGLTRPAGARRRPGSEGKAGGGRGEPIPGLTSGRGGARGCPHGGRRAAGEAMVAAALWAWGGAAGGGGGRGEAAARWWGVL
jgi:hypothetical protein